MTSSTIFNCYHHHPGRDCCNSPSSSCLWSTVFHLAGSDFTSTHRLRPYAVVVHSIYSSLNSLQSSTRLSFNYLTGLWVIFWRQSRRQMMSIRGLKAISPPDKVVSVNSTKGKIWILLDFLSAISSLSGDKNFLPRRRFNFEGETSPPPHKKRFGFRLSCVNIKVEVNKSPTCVSASTSVLDFRPSSPFFPPFTPR